MNDQQLRALVRDAIARHAPPVSPELRTSNVEVRSSDQSGWQDHASHYLYVHVASGTDACLIEPTVECTHCGYCKSHGH